MIKGALYFENSKCMSVFWQQQWRRVEIGTLSTEKIEQETKGRTSHNALCQRWNMKRIYILNFVNDKHDQILVKMKCPRPCSHISQHSRF